MIALVTGLVALIGFLVVETRAARIPCCRWGCSGSMQFTGANLVTLAVYAGLGSPRSSIAVELQTGARLLGPRGRRRHAADHHPRGAFSARAGALAQRIGPRLPMTLGSLVVAVGLLLYTRIEPGRSYVEAVLPGAVVFGIG